MSSTLFRAGLFASSLGLLFVCSCEEHHVGEYPEVQRDRMSAPQSPAPVDAESSPSPTPINFFRETKSP